jgi:hypothetical protein
MSNIDQAEAFTPEEIAACPLRQYTLAEVECDELRVWFNASLKRLKTVNPGYKFNKRSTARRLDVAMQNYCNELRRLAAEFDQAQHKGGQ